MATIADAQPTLTSARLTLRPLRRRDAAAIARFAGDARVARMTTSIPHPLPAGAAEAFVAGCLSSEAAEVVWAIEADRDDGPGLIGLISLEPRPGAEREIGYWIGPPFWGRGFASEAVATLIADVFRRGGVARVIGTVFQDNPASARVLYKAGFLQIGEDRHACVARGEDVARWVFARGGAGR
ncbi:MAG: GNAT family N-acetyltransferase [Pseudomonadota bacterium]